MSCTLEQAQRLFATMCFTTENNDLFEKTLTKINDDDWPIVFLASIIIENCGLKKIQQELVTAASNPKTEEDIWVSVPNQYILQDQAWLLPVIRACDPGKIVFKDEKFGIKLIEDLSDKFSINLRNNNDTIEVNISHSIDVVKRRILANPTKFGVTIQEFNSVMNSVFGEKIYQLLSSEIPNERRELAAQEGLTNPNAEELSKGLILLFILTLSFMATGMMSGYYYKPVTV